MKIKAIKKKVIVLTPKTPSQVKGGTNTTLSIGITDIDVW